MQGLIFVFLRIISYSTANVFQKKALEKGFPAVILTLAQYAAVTILSFPFAVIPGIFKNSEFLTAAVLATLFGTVGNIVTLSSLRRTELSVFGPVNSLKPVITLPAAWFLLGELPAPAALIGMAVIVSGSIYLAFAASQGQIGLRVLREFFFSRGILLRFSGMVLISVEAVFLKKMTVLAGPFETLFLWGAMGLPVLIIAALAFRKDFGPCKENLPGAALAALFYAAMQYFTLLAFSVMPAASALALFQLSAVLSVALGRRFFKEKGFWQRLTASLVMTAGGALVVLSR